MPESVDRGQFLNLAALFEGGLALLAFLLGWIAGIDPLATLRWEWRAAAWGALATLPMFGLFLVMHYFPIGTLASVRRFLIDHLGPLLDACRWHDLLGLAVIAGVSEEILFRGVLQPWLSAWGNGTGVVGSNLLFGLAHFITPTYAVLAALIGLYLSWVYTATGVPSLLAPILTHALYDWLAFLIVRRTYRAERRDRNRN